MLAILSNSTSIKCVIVINWNLLDFSWKVSQLHKSCHLHIFWGVQSKARTIFQESLEPVRWHETFSLRMKREYVNIQFSLYQLVFHRLVSFTSFTRHRLAQRGLGVSEIYRSHAWCCPFPIMKLGTLRSNDATATRTTIKKWICVLSVFIAIIPTHLLCQM